jgi:hypothetical protein
MNKVLLVCHGQFSVLHNSTIFQFVNMYVIIPVLELRNIKICNYIKYERSPLCLSHSFGIPIYTCNSVFLAISL